MSKFFYKVAPHTTVKFAAPAAAGSYEPGDMVMHDPATGQVLPLTASTDAGLCAAGVVTSGQTVAAGEPLEYEKGLFALSGALDAAAHNSLVYFDGSDTAFAQTAAEGKVVGGRYRGKVSGRSPFEHVIEIGYVVSGTLV